jgi:putative ABC transport system ATP-binding protein
VSPPEPPAASCAGLVKIFWSAGGEVHALKGVDARFPTAAITAVVGPSGSGKSSLLRILAGLDRPTAGQVRVGGTALDALPPRQLRRWRNRLVSYMFARPSDNLVPGLTADEHLRTMTRVRGVAREEARELLGALGLASRRRHRPDELSGGEQQRLALAMAVLGGPALVVADEPTAELDTSTGRALLRTMRQLVERGQSFVVATHSPVVVEAADRVVHLRHGAVEAETTAGEQLSVIDALGRVQLPPDCLHLFPDRRARIRIDEAEVRITPP